MEELGLERFTINLFHNSVPAAQPYGLGSDWMFWAAMIWLMEPLSTLERTQLQRALPMNVSPWLHQETGQDQDAVIFLNIHHTVKAPWVCTVLTSSSVTCISALILITWIISDSTKFVCNNHPSMANADAYSRDHYGYVVYTCYNGWLFPDRSKTKIIYCPCSDGNWTVAFHDNTCSGEIINNNHLNKMNSNNLLVKMLSEALRLTILIP